MEIIMTIEEKAKAYDEALARAKTYLTPDTPDRVDTVSAITTIFPKLAESEDEKVRNGLVRFLKELLELGGVLHDEWDRNECEKYIAWLEKQKEPNPFTGTGFNYNGNTWGMCARDNGVDILFNSKLIRHISEEKQAEQKASYTTMVETGDGGINALVTRELPTDGCDDEQKPAEWSEEDEDNFKHLLDEIVCLGNNRNSANRLYYDRLIKFIKELKNRAQPKEKWCDKDERMLDRLIAYFEKRVAFTDDDNPRYANWLKSLTPQNRWKPSELQLGCLSDAIEYYNSFGYPALKLKELYEQLKKLKDV